MQPTPLAYTRRNILAAFLLGIELVCFVAPIALFMLEERLRKAEGRPAWEGEAGGLMVIFLLPLAFYTLIFFATAVQEALRRGSRPLSGWTIFMGLLPIIGVVSLVVSFRM
jgi:hypothetical protein